MGFPLRRDDKGSKGGLDKFMHGKGIDGHQSGKLILPAEPEGVSR